MRKVIVLFIGVVIPALLIYVVYVGFNAVFEPNVNEGAMPYELYVEEGTTLTDLIATFERDQVLLNTQTFGLLAGRKGLSMIRPGHYVITAGMSNNTLINALKAGLQTPVRITFSTAENLADLSGKLSLQLMADSASLFEAFNQEMVGWEGPLALGAFLPDTYEVYWNATPESIAQKLYQNTISFWTPDRIRLASNVGLSPGEVSTLASIVMKESSKSDDRPLVARLYLNRLEKGMRLQADPTVIFAMRRHDPTQSVRRVLTKDLKIEDPYNTYFVKGLPPGPICVPEKAALLAVLQAPEHDYLFMCANPEKPGYHAFAKNYAGHLINQRKWTRYLDEQRIYR
jgi:UPF0755 protein